MGNQRGISPQPVQEFLDTIVNQIKEIIGDNLIGLYLHGSLAMGGFNPAKSDIDLLGVTKRRLENREACKLARLLLEFSGNPYPIEISFLNKHQLEKWEHPSLFDFHFSEHWRSTFARKSQSDLYINTSLKDEDLAAHITILHISGVCLAGRAIGDVFPVIPEKHYLSSIMNDSSDCIEKTERDPVYCILNLVRVYRYVKEKEISSKVEGAEWGLSYLPEKYLPILRKALTGYQTGTKKISFDMRELESFRDYVSGQIEKTMTGL